MIYYLKKSDGVDMKKVELLSPAGNMDSLKAAIEAGCDAVYVGGIMFGARAFAGNFSNDELLEAIKYAHLYGVKVYLTINTLVYDKEVDKFLEYVRFVHKNNIDAVIVQDVGMFDLLRRKFPKLEIHASTQMHIHTYDGALLAKKLGIKRIVMARETPIDIIKKIKEEIDIEVEVFIHGALCISYSGQCLASALIGKRSGNRGTCAQICRKKYDLYDENNNKLNDNNYLLSTKDLCTLEYLDELIEAGIDSFKIEGRMKRPEYVYLVTKIYRNAIDNYYKTGNLNLKQEDLINLKKIFNREFTKGFMLGCRNDDFTYEVRPNHKGIELGKVLKSNNNELEIKLINDLNVHDGLRIIDDKEDKGLVVNKMYVNNKSVIKAFKGSIVKIKYDKYVKQGSRVILTTDYNQLNEIDDISKNKRRKVLIWANVIARKNKFLSLEITDGINIIKVISDKKIEPSKNNPATEEIIKKQINKTGDTIYKFSNINVLLDDDIFINIKDINSLRRNAIDELNNKRLYDLEYEEKDYNLDVPNFVEEKKDGILVTNLNNYKNLKEKYDVIYTSNLKELNDDVIIKLSRVINTDINVKNPVLIGDFGSMLKYNKFETDFSFNVVNSYAVAFLHSMGAYRVTLSYELTLRQIENLVKTYELRYKKHPNLSVIIDSYPEAMVCKFNLNKKYKVKRSYLKDEFGNKLLVRTENDKMIIYHFNKVNKYDKDKLYDYGINLVRKNDL